MAQVWDSSELIIYTRLVYIQILLLQFHRWICSYPTFFEIFFSDMDLSWPFLYYPQTSEFMYEIEVCRLISNFILSMVVIIVKLMRLKSSTWGGLRNMIKMIYWNDGFENISISKKLVRYFYCKLNIKSL